MLAKGRGHYLVVKILKSARAQYDSSDESIEDEDMVCIFFFLFIYFLSHLLIAGCDIGVQISVRPFVGSSIRSFVRPSTFTSKFGFLDIRDSCESETLHSNCP